MYGQTYRFRGCTPGQATIELQQVSNNGVLARVVITVTSVLPTPPAPSGFTATATGTTSVSVSLSWDLQNGVSKYWPQISHLAFWFREWSGGRGLVRGAIAGEARESRANDPTGAGFGEPACSRQVAAAFRPCSRWL